MKRERTLKPDGRYVLYYQFEPAELVPPGQAKVRPSSGKLARWQDKRLRPAPNHRGSAPARAKRKR
jgi:sucrose-6-phosphate hydrolase SacC (GH32 family)